MFPEKSSDHINFISVKIAAERTGYTTDYLSRLAKNGKISATKTDDGWLLDESSLDAFVTESHEKRKVRAQALSEERKREYKFSGSTTLATYSAVENNPTHIDAVETVGTTDRFEEIGEGRREKIRAALFSVAAVFLLVGLAIAPHLITHERESLPQVAMANAVEESAIDTIALAWYHLVHKSARTVAGLFFESETTQIVHTDVAPATPLVDHIPDAPVVPGNNQRMVVVPIPEGTDPEAQARQIRNSFSDEVTVEPLDENSGIITPVFKSRSEDQYLYVMVPMPPPAQ